MSLALIRGLNRRQYVLGQTLFCGKRLNSNASSSTPPNDEFTKAKQTKAGNVKKNVQGYVFTRYIDYVQNYDKVLESKFPAAMHVYRVFLVGVKDFYNDMKKYLKVSRISSNSPEGLRALTRKELELYLQLPKDMKKVAPVLLISALPFANYVVFPLAYMFPRHLLTSHFWSIQQRSEFQQIFLKNRLFYNRKIYRILQSKLHLVKDNELQSKWNDVIGRLGSGLHPSADELLNIKELFTCPPYQLSSLSSKHLRFLCYVHGLNSSILKRYRLMEHAYVVHHMDLAIKREGGVHNMSTEALHKACFLRGLNPTNLSNECLIEWLKEWVKVSCVVNETNVSLFLHLPILISYNHPNNWHLIY